MCPELMFEAHRRAYLEYHHEVIVAGIDIYNLEAEADGAKVENTGEQGIPSIKRPLLRVPSRGRRVETL